MTVLVGGAAWHLLQRGQGTPRAFCFVSAIIVSSAVFGLGHLPLVLALGVRFSLSVGSYIVIVNSVFGLIAG
jgi:membrane protease YdiL (CAAX protease family)